jgi:hypothetical protein
MFLTNSLKKTAPYTLARFFSAVDAMSPSLRRRRCRISHLGVRSFIVEPNRQGPQEGGKEDGEQPRQTQQTLQEFPTNDYIEPPPVPRRISPYLTGLLVVGFGFTAYGL